MQKEVAAVDKQKQWWVVALFFILAGILTATWSSRIPDVQQKLRLDNAALGRVLFFLPVGLMVGLLFAGRLVAAFGIKRIMLAAAVLACCALLFAGWASTSYALMTALFFIGVCRTTFNLSINTAAVELQKQYDKPIISTFHGLWSLACLVAAGIGTAMIIQPVRPLVHFVIICGPVLVLSVLLFRKASEPSQPPAKKPFFVWPDRYLFLLGLIGLCAMLCEGAMFDWGVNYFEKEVHAGKSFVTAGYTAFISTMALGRLVGDRFISRFGVYRMLRINGALMATGFALAAIFPYLLTASLGFLLIGLGDSILVPMIYLLASQSNKMPSSYALQAVTLIGYTGFLIGPLFIGNVSQHWGMASAFCCLSGVCLLLIILSLQVKRVAREA
jgi:fucose permease